MNNQPQCPFCLTPFDSVELLTLHLIFDSCSLKHEGDGASESPAPAVHVPYTPELVPES